MIKFLKRIPWKDVLVTVLVVALGVGAIVGVGAAITNKQKTVSPLVFERGALDENGLHVESKTFIYTKDLIECHGLEIIPDFEASGTYQVFYYDTNKIFLGATSVMDAHSTATYKKGADFPYAAYARIVITPEVPVDDDGYVDEDYKVKFYEVTSIASKYTIKVNKEQKAVKVENLFENALKVSGRGPSYDDNMQYKEVELAGYSYCTVFTSNINSLKVLFEEAPGELSYFVYNKTSKCLSSGHFDDKNLTFDIQLPADSYMICIVYEPDNVPVIHRAG